ncbi:hypothetical protein D9Q98_007110 [Chlorella vulgaris]|uniref:FAS1 domain-containing protein n=1 Tax=Chlorella vulgaris TaxID=3077 RepID=A0A9D4YUN8_CHLVU|nr:hypothetical protein D9Q98_007110 [Chlorella vulgaris]
MRAPTAQLAQLCLLVVCCAATLDTIGAQQPGAAVTRATAHVSLRSNGGGGSKNSSRGENQDDGKEGGQPVCSDALWKLAKQAPDLQTLVAVQRLTTLNFFTPFGKSSRRHFTLFAPTDAAFFTLFNGTSGSDLQVLKDGFPALLLYHQYLGQGLSASQLAAQYDAVTALGPSVDDPTLDVEIDNFGGKYTVSGQAPNNYATVLRQEQACNNNLLVLDTVLLPMATLSQLPKLQPVDPITPQHWAQILNITMSSVASSQAAAAPSPAAAQDAAAAAAAARPAPGLPPVQSSNGGSSEGRGGGEGTAGGNDGLPSPRKQDPDLIVAGGPAAAMAPAPAPAPAAAGLPPLPFAPLPPGVPPDCAGLAASGRLINATGSLELGCSGAAVDDGVMSSGGTQTAVSDADQVQASAQAPALPPNAAPAAALAGAVAALASVLVWMVPVLVLAA